MHKEQTTPQQKEEIEKRKTRHAMLTKNKEAKIRQKASRKIKDNETVWQRKGYI
jgi:hypothetical protein